MSLQRRPRVLQVGKFYPPHMGGIETHLQVLCRELAKHIDVSVLVANDGPRDVVDEDCGIRITRAGTRFNISTAPVCPTLHGHIRRAEADILHLHHPNPTAVLAYLASGRRGPLVVTYHSDIVRQRIAGAAFGPLLRRTLERAEAVIATSPNYVESSPVLSACRQRVRVIPYGIPFEQFARADPAAVAATRARHGQRIVISVGRLIYYKGFEHLIRAMTEVDGHLLIVGDGPLRGELEGLARRLGVSERVTLLGEIQNRDVTPFYHAARVFALASTARSEAFGIVQLEAMAAGLPVVNTRLASGVPFVSPDGVSGITVPPEDPPALAAALNRLLDDAGLREAYGAAGRRRVAEEFSAEVMAARTLDLYREISNSPAR
jgi:rhamnosyl/mannosyltransferase